MKTVKDSDILKLAKEKLKDKSEYRVCFAIDAASKKLQLSWSEAGVLADWVYKMIKPHGCFEDWFIKYNPELASELGVTPFDHADKLRTTRIQWLDWMIAYCEKEESQKQQS